jgi:hypothetical protein
VFVPVRGREARSLARGVLAGDLPRVGPPQLLDRRRADRMESRGCSIDDDLGGSIGYRLAQVVQLLWGPTRWAAPGWFHNLLVLARDREELCPLLCCLFYRLTSVPTNGLEQLIGR